MTWELVGWIGALIGGIGAVFCGVVIVVVVVDTLVVQPYRAWRDAHNRLERQREAEWWEDAVRAFRDDGPPRGVSEKARPR